MKRKWIKRLLFIFVSPLILVFILGVCLYIPSVQNFIQKKISSYASEAMGMEITIGRVDLNFPIDLSVKDVLVLQENDTILGLDQLNVSVQFLPLFKAQVQLDEVVLQQAKVNTKSLIDGVRVVGDIGKANLVSRGVNLKKNFVRINEFEVSNANIALVLADTMPAPVDSISEPLDWKIKIDHVGLNKVKFNLDMPLDTLNLSTSIDQAILKNGIIDLGKEIYKIEQFSIAESSVGFKTGIVQPTKAFNPSHIQILNMNLLLGSVGCSGALTGASITNGNLLEKSGLSVNSLKAKLLMDKEKIEINNLSLLTPYSSLKADASIPFDMERKESSAYLNTDLKISLKEVANVLDLGITKGNFETWGPVSGEVRIKGNASRLDIDDFRLELDQSFMLTVVGSLFDVLDEKKRQGQLDVLGDFYDLNRFNPWLSDDNSITLPQNLVLRNMLAINGSDVYSEFQILKDKSNVGLVAKYNLDSEKYSVVGKVDSLDLVDFLPELPIKDIIAHLNTEGQFIDVLGKKAMNKLEFSLDHFSYEDWHVRNILINTDLRQQLLSTSLVSNNQVLRGRVDGSFDLGQPNLTLDYDVDLTELDLYKLKVVDIPIKESINIKGKIKANSELTSVHLNSSDFWINVDFDNSIEDLSNRSAKLIDEFTRQLEARRINYPVLQKWLPTTSIQWNLGKENIIASVLEQNGLVYESTRLDIQSSPSFGIDGAGFIKELKIDDLTLDTISLKVRQDSTHMELQTGVTNKFNGSALSFISSATVQLHESNASLLLDFELGGRKMPGLRFGVNVEPKHKGLLFTLIPENPVILFKKFSFMNGKNKLFLRDDLRLFAEVDMMEDRSVGFKMQSSLTDTLSKQNMNVELRRLNLEELVNLFPFLPDLNGFVSAESHYVQTDETLQLSADIFIDSLMYEKRGVGDFSLGATWIPISPVEDLVNMYMSHNRVDVLSADGMITSQGDERLLDIQADLAHFPISIADVIFPNEEIDLSGDLDGQIHITGTASAPKFNGRLVLDSVSIYAKQADAYFLFDSRPVEVVDSKVIFKDFSIYTTNNNPFKINGTVDISDMANPIIDLKLKADNYLLLNAKRRKESIVYGKLIVDIDATVKGSADKLKMRGGMSIKDKTDITYVLTESPLTVQDRLGDLVTFTSFDETVDSASDSVKVSLGGIDMVMSVHIDPSVRFKVDLSADRSSRVELQGGGDLSLQYNPQTDMTLIGRYTLSSGIIKYSLPIIPSKEFKITTDSYIEWTGKIEDPKLNLIAKDQVRASVAEADGSSHMVNFNVIIGAKNRLDNLELIFDLEAPESPTVQNQLAKMSKEDRNKQAIALLATGIYLAGGAEGKGGLDMGSALNSVLQSQINSLTGSTLKNATLSVGVEEYDVADSGKKRTDYSFSYAQRFMNDRIQIIIGGRVKTGEEVTNDLNTFIDNISIEYRLDSSGTRYVRVFRDKNYESVLDGEIIETGVGLVLRKKLSRLGELFIFKKKKK